MALGSSAPEIMLACVETILFIEDEPQELGPSTIVGSAAFNLLIISAVSIVSVDEVKSIEDMGVFAITSVFSIFAYIWMYIVLKVWSPDYVTIPESILTLIFLGLLIAFAYCADKWNQGKKNLNKTAEELEELESEKKRLGAKAALRRLSQLHGASYVIECVTGGIHSIKATAEEKEEIKKNFRAAL